MNGSNLLEGVGSEVIATSRLETHLLTGGPEGGAPIVFVHGNASSSRFFEDTLAVLPSRYRGLAPDLRGFGESEAMPLDATRGVADFSDDLRSLTEALGLEEVHLVGWSAGGSVAMRYATDYPSRVASLALVDPMSPTVSAAPKTSTAPLAGRISPARAGGRPTPSSSGAWRPRTGPRGIPTPPGTS
jgi:pimeloyl-ACP methyl ester carboxylesterase